MATKADSRLLTLLGLHILLGIYSLSDIASKTASGQPFLSGPFLFFYALVLVFLAIYALGWQQVIKRMPLSSAYANRAVTIVWGIFWGFLLFGEAITPGKIIGAIIIMVGIVLFARADRDETDETAESDEPGGTA